jgi:hypothetical protein
VGGSGAMREGEPAQGGSERRRRQRRGAEAEKRESTPAAQAARREAGDGSGQMAAMAAAWAQRREYGRGDAEAEAGARGQWRTVPSAAPVKSAAGEAAAAVTWWDGGDGDQSAATEWHFIAWGVGWRSAIRRCLEWRGKRSHLGARRKKTVLVVESLESARSSFRRTDGCG